MNAGGFLDVLSWTLQVTITNQEIFFLSHEITSGYYDIIAIELIHAQQGQCCA